MSKLKYIVLLLLFIIPFTGCYFNFEPSGTTPPGDPTPPPTEPETKPLKKRVVLIGVDGAGAYFNSSLTPNTLEIFKNYASTFTGLSGNPSMSAPSWGSLLTGTIPSITKFTNDSVKAQENQIHGTYPSIFKHIRTKYSDSLLASFCTWNAINHGIIEPNIGVYKNTAGDDETLTDNIINYLSSNDPNLLFVQFDDVDHAGHSSGYGGLAYNLALKKADTLIKRIFDCLNDKGALENTLFMITADHGGIGKGHGGYTDQEKHVFLGVRGNNVNNITMNDFYLRDMPAIISHFLDIEPHKNWDSFVPRNLFKDYTANNHRKLNYPFNSDTYELTAQNGLLSYIKKDNLTTCLTFDNDYTDYTGKTEVIPNGSLEYQKGVTGNAIHLSDKGYLKLDNLSLNNSFTIGTFVNIRSREEDPCLFANKDWADGENPGMVFALRDDDMKFNMANYSEKRNDVLLYYDRDDYINNWFHVLISYDKTNRQLDIYVNFSLEYTEKLDKDYAFFPSSQLSIGQDSTGKYDYVADMLIDDFLIFNTNYSKNNVKSLKNYYRQYGN